MDVDTGQLKLAKEILGAVEGVKTVTARTAKDVAEIKEDMHDMKREVYHRLSTLETHKAVVEEREKNRDEKEKDNKDTEKRKTDFWLKIISTLLVAGLLGAFGVIWGLSQKLDDKPYRDTWQKDGSS